MRSRLLEPEILDSLPLGDVRAEIHRRQLRRFNALMRNFGWFESRLREHLLPGESVLELGAGTGDLALFLRDRGVFHSDGRVSGLDLWPAPQGWPTSWAWFQGDLLERGLPEEAHVLLANLFLHHFEDRQLSRFGAGLPPSVRALIVNEPHRDRLSWLLANLSPLGGFHREVAHDARVSVRAGFRRGELPRLLGLDPARWSTCETISFPGALRLVALRR